MDRPPPTTTEPLYEPKERVGHAAVGVDGNVFLWGGWEQGLFSTSVVEVFNLQTGRWEQRKTTGTPPRGAGGGAYTTIGNKAYHFGGYDGSSDNDSLHSLDLSTMQWVTLQPRNPSQAPSRKNRCGMVAHGDNELIVFGGWPEGGQYTNELHVYNLREGTWSTPHVTGTPPPPCRSFSFTKYDDHHAVLFGGQLEGRSRVSDVYSLNMKTWHWSKLDTHGESHPDGRRNHTACLIGGPLMGSQHPQLLVIGGADPWDRSVLEGAWVLDLKSRTWRKVDLPSEVDNRWQHTATVVSSGPRSVMVVEFGGQRRLKEDSERSWLGETVAATTIVQIVSDSDQSRPGEPPTWRGLEVVSTKNPEKWRKKVDQLQKLGKIRSLLKKKKLIRTKGACIIYSGPPRVGKSTVLHRTVKDYYAVIPTLPSTPVAEKPLRIHIKKLSATRAAKKGSRWVEQTLQQEKQQLVGYSLSTHETDPEVMAADNPGEVESGASGSTTGPSETLGLKGSLAETTAAVETKAGARVYNTRSPTADTKASKTHLPLPVDTPAFETPDDIVREALHSAATLHEDLDLLEGSIMLHILDTGGQPQFMQVLPMLYTGPSINLLVFKLNEGLEERYVIEYLSPDGKTTEPCVSSFTVEQVLFQALSSASFRAVPAVTPVTARSSSSQSATIFVGTHKDKVSQKEIDSIDDALQRKLRNSTIPNNKVVKYRNPTKQCPCFSVVVPIDNTSIEDPGILLLQDLVNDVLQKQFDDYDTPLAWLMFHLCIRSTNARVLSLQQCTVIGKACGIDDEEELKLALWYLSHQCGVFRYYSEVEGLQDLVICDLQVLFDSLTGLISSAFHFRKAFDEEEVHCRETGRFPVTEVEKLLEHAQSDIPPQKLITLFEHLRILCRCTHSSGVQQYFVPCILPSYEIETIESSSSSNAPLLLTFSCGYCPMGYFSALIVHMASSDLCSSLKWRLCEGKLFRNKVSFHVGKDFDEVTLISRPTFYEVQIDRKQTTRNPLPLHEVCNEIRSILDVALSTIKSSFNSSFQLHHHVAFYCQNPECYHVPHPAISDSDSDDIAVCTCSKLPSQLTFEQCIWFGQSLPQEPCIQREGKEKACHLMAEVVLEQVDDAKIDEDDLSDVLEEVTDVTKWFDTGLALGLKYSTLEKIKIKNREDVDDCRRDMLVCWLRRMDKVDQKGLPSWRSLVRALSSKLAYNPEIAGEIARKHPKL